MSITNARQPKGIPVGGQFAATSHAEPKIQLQSKSTLELAAEAAAAAADLTEKRNFLRRQQVVAARRHQAIACAAAAHHVLQEHPNASVLVFEVRDEKPYRLTEVFDSGGNRVCKKPAGDWADDALREIRDESVYDLNAARGVDVDGATELRVNLDTALPAALERDGEVDLATEPLGEGDRKVLADAATDAYAYLSGMLYGDAGPLTDEAEIEMRKQVENLSMLLGYAR